MSLVRRGREGYYSYLKIKKKKKRGIDMKPSIQVFKHLILGVLTWKINVSTRSSNFSMRIVQIQYRLHKIKHRWPLKSSPNLLLHEQTWFSVKKKYHVCMNDVCFLENVWIESLTWSFCDRLQILYSKFHNKLSFQILNINPFILNPIFLCKCLNLGRTW